MIYNETNDAAQKVDVLDYLEHREFPRVLDIGGGMNPWASDFVTHYLDFQKVEIVGTHTFIGDVCIPDTWMPVMEDVASNGLFDFIICSHLLEDIRDPYSVLHRMGNIGKEGFIATPSKYTELTRGVECVREEEQRDWGMEGEFKGFIHHRWIFSVYNGVLRIFPKLVFVEYMTGLEWVADQGIERASGKWTELCFWWMDSIPFEILNNDFIGPNGPTYMEMYRDRIREGI